MIYIKKGQAEFTACPQILAPINFWRNLIYLCTLRIAAGVADTTATFVLNRTTTVRAGTTVLDMDINIFTLGQHVLLDRLGNSIRTGGDAVITETCRFVAGDTDQLFDCLPGLNAGSPSERDEAADCLTLRCGTAARLAHCGKELEGTVAVLIDCYVKRNAAGFHLVS